MFKKIAISLTAVLPFAGALVARADTGSDLIASTTPILTGGVATLSSALGAFLPILLPVAIILGIFFGVFLYIKRAGRKH